MELQEFTIIIVIIGVIVINSFFSPSSLPEFFKFKGFGSLSSLPRSFTLRRSSTPISIRPHLEPDAFEATQDDMVTIPKSPPAYARSSDMYSHMGTMPRPGIKRVQDQRATQKAKEVSPEPHLVPRGLPDPPGLEAAKEVIVEAHVPPEDTPAVGSSLAALEVDSTTKSEDLTVDIKEERAPRDMHPEG